MKCTQNEEKDSVIAWYHKNNKSLESRGSKDRSIHAINIMDEEKSMLENISWKIQVTL